MRELGGKVAVVTGGGSGIGKQTCLALAREGATVAVVDLDETAAKQTVEAITAAGGSTAAYGVDVSSEAQMGELRAAVLRDHGVVDVVVNNAGIITVFKPTVETPTDLHRQVWEVNYLGVLHGCIHFLPDLLERPESNLVNVASYAGILGVPGISAYVSSKYAVRGLTECIRMELPPKPVTVTLVCPGATKTPIMTHSAGGDEELRNSLQSAFDNAKATSAETVAEQIVKGIKRNRPRVLTGTDTKMLDKLVRLAPGGYARLLRGPMQKELKKLLG